MSPKLGGIREVLRIDLIAGRRAEARAVVPRVGQGLVRDVRLPPARKAKAPFSVSEQQKSHPEVAFDAN